ncbi:hypothetical protein KAFR_0F01830 [Kazachstania africana CBS 2517]|uniref:Cell wall mannoprotein PIR1-like C-terminal domain-containing protein n=1 Tax=Kazachstania africana (strain ATCC 22294 / BCRC 22015 / CBS 2517 / CECT 1963 / NBRC 1671 / NRRL Y-8276) TaxID=1071382 RepID=H2AWN0_KAZAF|nr:hypothetical protein KAFR_0F01830 [Kazachstania africana CBS 2517]CCF58780.1 hypothetical protein KAFR_0F01830 [Kazachstania africana CBS 2517]
MQFKKVALAASAAVSTVSASGYTPGNPWNTLTPNATYSCGVSQYTSTFGIAIQTIGSSLAKRAAISQIGDGQIQGAVATSTVAAASQITDGQVEATASSKAKTTLAPSSSPSESSSSASKSSSSASTCATASFAPSDVSCSNSGTLSLSLNDGILTDENGRIGSIVANRQFQFDGPPPQAGAIYAAGWSITPDGNLALGDNDVFYECLSGNFYNLYDESIGAQCSPIHLEIVGLVDC